MKTKTITSAALCVAMAACLTGNAQDVTKVKEVGLGFSNFRNFSLQYRWGNEKKLYRLSGDIGGFSSFGNSSTKLVNIDNYNVNNDMVSGDSKRPVNFSTGLNFTILKLNAISEKFGLMYGAFYGAGFSLLKDEATQTRVSMNTIPGSTVNYPITSSYKTERQTYSVGLGIALGAYYKISSSFLLYAEIDPNVFYAYNKTKSTSSQRQSQPQPISNSVSETSENNSFGISGLNNSYAAFTLVYRFNAKKA